MSRLNVLSVRDIDIMIVSILESQHVRNVHSDDIDDSKVVEDVHVPPETVSIIKGITIDFSTPILDEAHIPYDSTSDDMNEIVESNIPAMPRKSIEFSCAEYSFMIVLTELYSSESPEFLSMIQINGF